MSIKYKIPLILLTAFILNIILLSVYFRFFMSTKVDQFMVNMQANVTEAADELAHELEGMTVSQAIEILDGFEEGQNFVISLIDSQNSFVFTSGEELKGLSFSQYSVVELTDGTYMLLVRKDIEISNFWNHSIFHNLLYFEIGVLFVIFVAIMLVVHFRYVSSLIRLNNKVKHFKDGEFALSEPQSRDEIARLEQNFDALIKRLDDEKQLQNQIIASISHDIKTPLTSVLGYCERLTKKDMGADRQKEYAEKIHSSAKDIEAIVDEFDDYLSLSAIGKTSPQEYKVAYIADMLRNEYTELLAEQGSFFELKNECESYESIKIDLLRLRRVYANIISNSVRHAKTDKLKISVTLKKASNQLICSIFDNGKGVPPNELAHIFEPFHTSDRGRKVSGLGLSICKRIITSYGGKISATNENDGFGITFTLPITNA